MTFFNISRCLVGMAVGVTLAACQSTPAKPEPRYVPTLTLAQSTILHVLPQRAACYSSTPMQCLLVKSPNVDDTHIFGIGYNDIIGFEAKNHTNYTLKVRQEFDANTNQPTGIWHLEEILSQTPAH